MVPTVTFAAVWGMNVPSSFLASPIMPGDVEGVAEVSPGPEYDRGTLVVAALAYQGVPLRLARFVSGETVEEIRDDVAELAGAWKRMHANDDRRRGSIASTLIAETKGTRVPPDAAKIYGNPPNAARTGVPDSPRFNPADYQ